MHERVESYFSASKPGKTSEKAVNGTPKTAKTPKPTPDSKKKSTKSPSQKQKSKASNLATPSKETPVPLPKQTPVPLPKFAVNLSSKPKFDPSAFSTVDDKFASNSPPEQSVGVDANGNTFSVRLPTSKIQTEEYMDVEDSLDAPQYLSAKREDIDVPGEDDNLIGNGLDQKQRAQAALDSLESQLRSIFRAVGKAYSMEQGYENLILRISDQDLTINDATSQKLHGAIQKTIELKSFDSVPIEDLMKIIKLSEVGIKQADDLNTQVDESWDEAGIEAWMIQFTDLELALKSARVCLRMLTGGREDKQLYSESLILKCINLAKVMSEDIITPLVELRSVGTGANLFKLLHKQKKRLSALFVSSQRLFAVIAELVASIELSETAINTLEYMASKLIFVENAYTDRDSVVGAQKFDGIRSVAMDILCQIFIKKPEQRQGIINDILTSLEKLPVGKLSSRQFKLADGGSIQPVSALIMRLVQASSGQIENNSLARRDALLDSIKEDDDGATKPTAFVSSLTSEQQAEQQHAIAIQELESLATPLVDAATRNASHVINFIVKRAVGTTKTGDTPYRNLLDLFVEDFTTCLDSPDWPAAELLLRLLMLMMVQLFEAPKTAVATKNMALELLGTMSAAISRLRSHVKTTASSFEGGDSDELSRYLADLAVHVLDRKSSPEQIIDWAGPFRTTLEYLQTRCSADPHLTNAMSFLIAEWAARTQACYDGFEDEDGDRDTQLGSLSYRLQHMLHDRSWLSSQYSFKSISANQAKLSFSILLLKSPLCESFAKILNILLASMASDQATVRSRSLKSINVVIETDPSILDGDSSVIQLILECASDSSTQVRDSALGLLGSCIGRRPALEPTLTPNIIDRFQDAGVGVRKRAMRLARDIYLRNRNKTMRSAIANGLLRRIQDPDEGVRDLGRQMIEEVWFAPFYDIKDQVEFETSISEHAALVIQTVKTGAATDTIDKVFQTILKPNQNNKSPEGSFAVCSKLVSHIFGLLDSVESEDDTAPSGADALQVLTIFAKADPSLFNMEQIRLLKPHLASFTGADELVSFRAVTVIYRLVLPRLTTVNNAFLGDVRAQLLKAIGKISSRGALDDLIACAKTVCELLKDFNPMGSLMSSSLLGLHKLGGAQLGPKQLNVVSAYSIIVGYVGKHCNLEQFVNSCRAKFPTWKGDSVTKLFVDIMAPFTAPNQPLEARKASLEAIGLVCQSWPRNYALAKVYTAFQQAFKDRIPSLEAMILRSFKEFLVGEERRSEPSADAPAPKKKNLTVMGGTNFDDVASATTQRFLEDITRIALGSQDEIAFLAMEVLGSINRQGLTHPKETGITLITLETSSNKKIAELAFIEHRTLHEKHETVLEREYIKAVQAAYEYQRDIVGDCRGATTDPFQSKLHMLMDVLKISKMKNRQRFVEKLSAQVDFDVSKLDASTNPPKHVDYARFIVENLAYLEYQTIGEVQSTVKTLEKIVSTTGAAVAQAIESEVFNVTMDAEGEIEEDAEGEDVEPPPGEQPAAPPPPTFGLGVDERRLRQLTAASIVLLIVWDVRSYLRRLYNMGASRHDSKAKGLAKDLNKAPIKVQGVHGDKVWEEIGLHSAGLDSNQQMGSTCRALVELMNVDKEFKVAEEEDEDGPSTPSEAGDDDDDEDEEVRGRKRKGGNTPGGRKKRARSSSRQRDDMAMVDDWA